MHDIIAGIDVHKRVLMVVVGAVVGAAADDGSGTRSGSGLCSANSELPRRS